MGNDVKAPNDKKLVKRIGDQIGSDLSMIIDRDLAINSIEVERITERVAADGGIHISFRLEFQVEGEAYQGCLLMPLPDAVSVACYLMVMPDEGVKAQRSKDTLDRSTKDAMLEVGNFVGGSSDAILRKWNQDAQLSCRSIGCQGVASDDVPNFTYELGSELILARIEATLGEFSPFTMLLQIPALLSEQ